MLLNEHHCSCGCEDCGEDEDECDGHCDCCGGHEHDEEEDE